MDISGDAVFGIGIVVFKKPETVFDQIIEIRYIFLSTTALAAVREANVIGSSYLMPVSGGQ